MRADEGPRWLAAGARRHGDGAGGLGAAGSGPQPPRMGMGPGGSMGMGGGRMGAWPWAARARRCRLHARLGLMTPAEHQRAPHADARAKSYELRGAARQAPRQMLARARGAWRHDASAA